MNIIVVTLIAHWCHWRIWNIKTDSRKRLQSDDEDGKDGGQCQTHKKSVLYFYCETHLIMVCRECTVLEHPVNQCNIIPIKEYIKRRKNKNVHSCAITHGKLCVSLQKCLMCWVMNDTHWVMMDWPVVTQDSWGASDMQWMQVYSVWMMSDQQKHNHRYKKY